MAAERDLRGVCLAGVLPSIAEEILDYDAQERRVTLDLHTRLNVHMNFALRPLATQIVGDKSGEFLYKALYDAGFANRPVAVQRDDGLELQNAYITASARCAPPDNKPLPQELLNCRPYLERELEILKPRAILALGKIGWDVYLSVLKHQGLILSRATYPFAHGAEAKIPAAGVRVFGVYHPSQQNTQTGKVTLAMYAKVLRRIQRFLATEEPGSRPSP